MFTVAPEENAALMRFVFAKFAVGLCGCCSVGVLMSLFFVRLRAVLFCFFVGGMPNQLREYS